LSELGSPNYLFATSFSTAFDLTLEVKEETIYGEIKSISFTHHDRVATFADEEKLGTAEPIELAFWEALEEKKGKWQAFVNEEILGAGIELPYWALTSEWATVFGSEQVSARLNVFYNK
jgi:hypothetical protein